MGGGALRAAGDSLRGWILQGKPLPGQDIDEQKSLIELLNTLNTYVLVVDGAEKMSLDINYTVTKIASECYSFPQHKTLT